jgi:hypothetical protein
MKIEKLKKEYRGDFGLLMVCVQVGAEKCWKYVSGFERKRVVTRGGNAYRYADILEWTYGPLQLQANVHDILGNAPLHTIRLRDLVR